MEGIRTPKKVRTFRLFLNRCREICGLLPKPLGNTSFHGSMPPVGNTASRGIVSPAAISCRTISVMRSHCPSVVAAKRAAQLCSSAKSAGRLAAMASCASSGSLPISAIACSSSLVIRLSSCLPSLLKAVFKCPSHRLGSIVAFSTFIRIPQCRGKGVKSPTSASFGWRYAVNRPVTRTWLPSATVSRTPPER